MIQLYVRQCCVQNNTLFKLVTLITNHACALPLFQQENKLSGRLPDLQNLLHVEEVDLNSNAFEGEIPQPENVSKLRVLSLHNNKISGKIPTSFINHKHLEILSLNNNHLHLDKAGINTLAKLENLRILALDDFEPSSEQIRFLKKTLLDCDHETRRKLLQVLLYNGFADPGVTKVIAWQSAVA